jgi:uncharacterized membrane protein YqaE (UPF0057 family)
MGCGRALLCIIFPPLAVLDRGCGTILIVTALTLAGWIPGALAALFFNMQTDNNRKRRGGDWD